jgi:hypothetical protein
VFSCRMSVLLVGAPTSWHSDTIDRSVQMHGQRKLNGHGGTEPQTRLLRAFVWPEECWDVVWGRCQIVRNKTATLAKTKTKPTGIQSNPRSCCFIECAFSVMRCRKDCDASLTLHAASERGWCGRGDSNPHGIATASPSSWCVCQFRHFRKEGGTAKAVPDERVPYES